MYPVLKSKEYFIRTLILQVSKAMTASVSTVVNITEGAVRGKELTATSFSKKKFFAFQGIPYAQPPVGSLRFKDPRPLSPWEGVRDATREAPSCPQKHAILKQMFGEEDNCLSLNVYTPHLPSSSARPLPVMVWIHGGGFTFGSGDTDLHDPDYWMERDVVIVTCNYRVGAFGFLSLGTAEVPGNAGLKDQVMVLRWVQRNIDKFHGDPSNVTLFGESAGAASVHYHLFSPMSRGLFHRAIMMSGCCLNSWASNENRSFHLGQSLGFNTTDPQELLTLLQGVPVFDLVKAQYKVVTPQDKQNLKFFPFVPCIEAEGGEGERFLTENPRSLLQKGLVAPVPLIIGATDMEGMIVMNQDVSLSDDYFKELNNDFSRIVPNDMNLPPTAPEKIKHFFFGNQQIGWDNLSKYMDYFGDVFFYNDIDETVRLHLACGVAPVYCYSLTFDGQFGTLSTLIRIMNPQLNLKGVCHGDDIEYMFRSNLAWLMQMSELPNDAPEIAMVSTITGMWRQFAVSGNPNMDGQNVKWEPAVKAGSSWRGHLELNVPPVMRDSRLGQPRREFWDTLLQPRANL